MLDMFALIENWGGETATTTDPGNEAFKETDT